MSDADVIQLDRRDDGVALVTLNNPKVNSLSTYVLRRLRTTMSELQNDLPGAVVITGGDRIFAAGADISEFDGPDEAYEIGLAFRDAFDAVAALPRVTIAAITGFASRWWVRARARVRSAHRGRQREARSARSASRHRPGWRWHPAPGASRRRESSQGPDPQWPPGEGGRSAADRTCRRGRPDRSAPRSRPRTRGRIRERRGGRAGAGKAGHRRRTRDCRWPRDSSSSSSVFVDVFHTQDSRIGIESFREHGPGKATFTGR